MTIVFISIHVLTIKREGNIFLNSIVALCHLSIHGEEGNKNQLLPTPVADLFKNTLFLIIKTWTIPAVPTL